ncbi:hypothetical protein MRX96_055977 [Rhipicephalus microplus]
MSLLGVGVSLAGLAVAASLEKFLDDLGHGTCLILTSQVLIIGGCGMSFMSAFVHCYQHNINEVGARYSLIVLSGVTSTAICFGHIAGILFDTYIMEGLPYVQGLHSLLKMQLLVAVLLFTMAVYCKMNPRAVARMGYLNPNGSLRL